MGTAALEESLAPKPIGGFEIEKESVRWEWEEVQRSGATRHAMV